MAEYSKKTVAELQEILKSRGLASSGKKADLIARLNEADKAAESEVVADSAPEATSAPELAEPVDVEPDTAQTETLPQVDNAANEISTTDTEDAPTVETKIFTLNLAGTDVEDEIAKRKARAERFKLVSDPGPEAEGTEEATADPEALKSLERAQRFGTGQPAVSRLDEALPAEDPRGRRGRKRHGDETNGSRRGRFGKQRRGGGPDKPTGVAKPVASFNNQADKDAAEARKKRFAPTT